MRGTRRLVLGSAVLALAALAIMDPRAGADVLSPGHQRVDFHFRVTGLSALGDRVLLAVTDHPPRGSAAHYSFMLLDETRRSVSRFAVRLLAVERSRLECHDRNCWFPEPTAATRAACRGQGSNYCPELYRAQRSYLATAPGIASAPLVIEPLDEAPLRWHLREVEELYHVEGVRERELQVRRVEAQYRLEDGTIVRRGVGPDGRFRPLEPSDTGPAPPETPRRGCLR